MRKMTGGFLRLPLAGAAALVGALLVAVLLPATLLYPKYCGTYPSANGVPIQTGQWCIEFNPSLGRYGDPPPNVPADMSQAATADAHPDNVRLLVGSAVFVLLLVGGWSVLRRLEPGGADSPRDMRQR